jgi:Pectate lyase superfamily protein
MTTNLVDASITRPGTGTVTRTFGERMTDRFIVRDFGAVANGTTDDGPSFQKAINAAISKGGGTVYVPSGNYAINTRIVIPGSSSAALTILGDGCYVTAGTPGSTLSSANLNDYILYIGHSNKNSPKMPVKLIQGIGFKNGKNTGTMTSTEPPASPDGTSGDGFGCLYIGSAGTGMSIVSCDFSVGRGIDVFSASNFLSIIGTNMSGGWVNNTSPSLDSIGLLARSVRLFSSKIYAVGTCCELIRGISQIDHMNMEVSGVGIHVGQNRLAYWEPDAASCAGAVIPALSTATDPATGETWAHVPAGMATLQFETVGIAAVRLIDATNFVLNVTSGAYGSVVGFPFYGIYTERIRRCSISGDLSGGYQTATVALGQGGAKGGGNKIEGVIAANSMGPTWILPTASHYDNTIHDDPYSYLNCGDQDGGRNLADLPTSPSAGAGTVYVVVNNSDLPAFSGTSNVGRAITTTGAANQKVVARWNSQTGQYVIAG